MASQQKSIEDYRNAVKLLKLKVIKLQKINEELQDKLREQGIPLDTGNHQEELTNQNVMATYARSCKRIGLTPEMMYRAADKEQIGEISSEDFRLFLSRVRLGLNQAQLTMLVRVIDEDCSGIIKKEEYYNSLQAYAINEEKQQGQARTYGQEALLKYARLLIENQLSVEDSFQKMESDNVTPLQFVNFVHGVDQQGIMNEKEMVAVFNHIDVNKTGTLQRAFYDQEVRKAIRAASSDLGLITGSHVFPKTNPAAVAQMNSALSKNNNLYPPKFTQSLRLDESRTKINESHASINENQLMMSEEDRKNITMILTKLKSQGVDAIEFIKKVIQNLQIPSAGILLYDVYKHFDKKIPKQDQLYFFQAIDLNKNGSIDYDELMVVFLEFKAPQAEYELLFEILTRKLQALGISINKYLAMEQIYEDTELTSDDFFPLAQMLFNTPKKKHSDLLFQSMDRDKSGILSAGEIIQEVRKIMDIYVPPDVINLEQTLNKSIMKSTIKNVGEYAQLLIKLKPTLSEDDYFMRYKMEGSGRQLHRETTQWATIFTSDLACLRYVYEVVAELDKNPGCKWDDPEFGPIADDPHGSKSMYFAENDIPEGSPHPKECQWLRPEELVAKLIDQGHDNLKDKHIDVFDEDGAASNDVCQSKYLGNCWFISALSIISGYDKYLQGEFEITAETIEQLDDKEVQGMLVGVYPPCFQFLRKYGIYVMRFFKNFGWKYVVIDDKLCVHDNDYVYGKCRNYTEVWVNLIEKAYAKLHQNYFALTAGDIAQGLADMTGKVPDKFKLEEKMDDKAKQELWDLLVKCKEEGTMLGCSAEGDTELYIKINDEDTGIMSGHAYGILDVFELKDANCKNSHKSHRLLKIRNPWGYGEWKMKWSEDPNYIEKLDKFLPQIDEYYTKEIAKAMEQGKEPPERYQSGVDDGTFLMCFKSWRTVFSNLFQCIDFPNDWSGLRAFDRFGLQTSGSPKKQEASLIAYAQKNPQYIIDLNRKDGKQTTLYIQMTQIDGRLFWGERYPYQNVMKPILICLFKLEGGEKCLSKFDPKKMVASSEKLNLRREIDTNEFKMGNGRYALIPCTKEPGQSIEYTISVYFDCQKTDINLSKYGDARFKFGPIAEEEEEVAKAPEELRRLLKKQAQDVLSQQK